MPIGLYLLIAILAYVLGSTPTGYWFGRLRGIDIRTAGSGNIGATNVFRVLGRTAGILVLAIDALKGFAAVAWIPPLVFHLTGNGGLPDLLGNVRPENIHITFFIAHHPWQTTGRTWYDPEVFHIIAGLAAILGHNYTFWLKFKGGKGIATSAGVLIAMFPSAFLFSFAVWLVVFVISRYVSLASIAAALALPFGAWFFNRSPRMIGVAILMSALAIYKHKSNIQRLLNGTENRAGKKKEQAP